MPAKRLKNNKKLYQKIMSIMVNTLKTSNRDKENFSWNKWLVFRKIHRQA